MKLRLRARLRSRTHFCPPKDLVEGMDDVAGKRNRKSLVIEILEHEVGLPRRSTGYVITAPAEQLSLSSPVPVALINSRSLCVQGGHLPPLIICSLFRRFCGACAYSEEPGLSGWILTRFL